MSDLTPPRLGNDAPAASASTSRKITRALVRAASGTTINPLDREAYAVQTNRGYGEAMGRGLELAITLLVMVGLGALLDHFAGTSPVFVIVLSILGFAGIGTKLYLGYDLEMKAHDDGAVWSRGSGEGEAPNQAPAFTDHSGAASAVADQLAADDRHIEGAA
jgi:F0F1-type ATP synthase assembly protein I